jgi:hypothetical protein
MLTLYWAFGLLLQHVNKQRTEMKIVVVVTTTTTTGTGIICLALIYPCSFKQGPSNTFSVSSVTVFFIMYTKFKIIGVHT